MSGEQDKLARERERALAKQRTTVLVVDDEPAFQETVARYLAGYKRLTAYNGWQAQEILAKHHVDVVLLDLNLPDTTGLKLLKAMRAEREDVEVIIITSHAEIKNAVLCVKEGAFDFLAKSYENYQRIGDHVERALEHRRRRRAEILARADESLRDTLQLRGETRSPELAEVIRVIRQVAATPLTVLLEGEAGVGKEMLARFLHTSSERATGPFVPVNLASMPGALVESTLFGHEKGAVASADRQRLGKFELADGGTLFLDEVGELDAAAQAKLLRALQEREVQRIGAVEAAPVDVRVVASTRKDLEAEVLAGRFREDLWFRLNVVRVRVPPLRQRRADIPFIIELLAARHARVLGRPAPIFIEETLNALAAYSWPGNVRELENLILRLCALHPGRNIRMTDVPAEYCIDQLGVLALRSVERDKSPQKTLYSLACEHFERYVVRNMIERCNGNQSEAARRLGISRSTLKAKLDGRSSVWAMIPDPAQL